MESISPFPNQYIIGCKFLGTLVFNHLSPSSHERRIRQSHSSGSRRLNRGSCCTPKFALSFLKNFITRFLLGQDYTRFDQLRILSQHWQLKTRAWICTSTIGLLMPHVVSMDLIRISSIKSNKSKFYLIHKLQLGIWLPSSNLGSQASIGNLASIE